jgi:type IV secretory pathway VirB2 component (pilin)
VTRVRAWVLPLAGLCLILYANAKIVAACGCSGEPGWAFYLLSMRPEPGARALILALALGVQVGLCLLFARNRYLQIAVVFGVVAVLIAPDMSLLAASKAHPFSANAWQDAMTNRAARVTAIDFVALFVNLATALYRSNAYILKRI